MFFHPQFYLLSGQNSEALQDLFGGVVVLRLPRHEVEEGVKSDAAGAVRVHDRQDAREVSVTLKTKEGKCQYTN